MRDAEFRKLMTYSFISESLIKTDGGRARMHRYMGETAAHKVILKTTNKPSPKAFSLVVTPDRHLTDLGVCRGKRDRNDASDQIAAFVEQTEVHRVPLSVDIFIIEAQAERHAQHFVPQLAFLAEIV